MAAARSVLAGSTAAMPALLLAVALLAAARVAFVVGGSACDGKVCGMGTCKEAPALAPLLPPLPPLPPFLPPLPPITTPFDYECDCFPGWSRVGGLLPVLGPSTPCYIPTCISDIACYTPAIKGPPVGNVTASPCLAMDCGSEGTCVLDDSPDHFHCQCKPGAANVLNKPALPCIKDCVIGEDGCPIPTPPPSPPPPSAAPPGNHDSSGPNAPSSTKGNATSLGSVSLQLLLLLMLASLAALHAV